MPGLLLPEGELLFVNLDPRAVLDIDSSLRTTWPVVLRMGADPARICLELIRPERTADREKDRIGKAEQEAGRGGGQGAGAGHEIEALRPVVLDGGPGRGRSLAAEHAGGRVLRRGDDVERGLLVGMSGPQRGDDRCP